jgi:two-component system response regulator DegU
MQLDASRTSTSRAGESLRILVADDFVLFRESLYSLFQEHKSLTIVGEAADGEAAIEMAFRLTPHVIIMDVKMPRISGVEATRKIKRFLPRVHVIGVSTRDDIFIKESMKAAGSSHFVTKDCAHILPDVISSITGWPVTNDHIFEGPLD